METKQCTGCKEVKPVSEFNKARGGLTYKCKSCIRAYREASKDKIEAYYEANRDIIRRKQKDYREANKDKIKAYRKVYGREYIQLNRDLCLLNSIRKRSKDKGLEFNLKLEDIAYPECCPVFGFKLERSSTGRATKNSPSVDRIIPELGYVKGNIQVLSQMANTMKHNATPEELLMFADWIIKTYRK